MESVASEVPEVRQRRLAWIARWIALLAPGWAWLGVLLMAAGFTLIYLMITSWPAAIGATGKSDQQLRIHWFGWTFHPSRDAALLLIVVLASALGSYVHAATSFADFAGNRKLSASWTWWYLLRVFIGSSLAVLFYFAVRGGFMTGSDNSSINPYGTAALAGLVGLFSKQATDKLREIFDTAFRVRPGYGDDARGDGIANPQPMLIAADPPKLTATQTLSLALHGSGFTATSVARVTRPTGAVLPLSTTFVDGTTLRVQLEPADVAGPGILDLSVYTPPPGGGTSPVLALEIAAAI